MSFDFSSLDTKSVADEGAIMEVRHPVSGVVLRQKNGDAVTVTLAGEDSERFHRATRAQSDRRLKARQSGRRTQISAEEIENDNVELLASVTLGWNGLADGPAEYPFSLDNARKAYTRWPWLREQVEAFVTDRANFVKASLSN